MSSLLPFFIRDQKINSSLSRCGINADRIAILNKSNGPSNLSLGGDVPNAESMTSSAETTIGKKSNDIAKSSTHDGTGRGKHLWKTRTSLGSFITNDNDVTSLNFFILQSTHHQLFIVIHPSSSLPFQQSTRFRDVKDDMGVLDPCK